MITRNRIRISEEQAATIWQQAIGAEFISTDDERLNVIYPGRINHDNGPDFRDAVVARRFRLTKGDVEVHVRSSDWYNHEHHINADYNNVILHVAMWHDCDSATMLQNGRPVPLLCLAHVLRHQAYLLPYTLPCFRILDHMDDRTLGKILIATGEERFRQKATHLQAGIPSPALTALGAEEAASQVLYRHMMRALGYTKNAEPFEDLACRMPLAAIEFTEGLPLKQAMLLGTAGLLPCQRRHSEYNNGKEVRELGQIWQSMNAKAEAMKESDWNLSRTYPHNSPVRRIIAQSYLLERYRKERLLPAILQLVNEASPPRGHHVLEDGLTVAGDGYWLGHFDFDIGSRAQTSTLLGNGKAAEIAVNVILPFVFSWAESIHDPRLKDRAIELYHDYPRPAENCITRHMVRQLCLGKLSGFTACHQQGLMHIFRNYCREGRCGQCPLLR